MGEWSYTAVKALFSLPEADVLPTWQALISDPSTPHFVLGFAVDQLARVHSLAASDLVAQVLWEPTQNVDTDQSGGCTMALDEIARAGGAGVKKHVDDLYKAHGPSQEYELTIAD